MKYDQMIIISYTIYSIFHGCWESNVKGQHFKWCSVPSSFCCEFLGSLKILVQIWPLSKWIHSFPSFSCIAKIRTIPTSSTAPAMSECTCILSGKSPCQGCNSWALKASYHNQKWMKIIKKFVQCQLQDRDVSPSPGSKLKL